ncbi:hypothetical protein JCM11491_001684 [Sporobolomyces phaffii]
MTLVPPSASSPGGPVSALVSSTVPPPSNEPSPTDLLLATPPSLLRLFALAAPAVDLAVHWCDVVTWHDDTFFHSLLVLLAWWAVCLFGHALATYGLNAAVLAFVLARYFSTAARPTSHSHARSSASVRPPTLTPAAYAHLLASSHRLFAHLDAFRTSVALPLARQFSFVPPPPTPLGPAPAPAYRTARVAVTSYPVYLAVTYLVPVRYLFLVAGSVAILWHAPFFATLRTVVWQSAAIRWLVRVVASVALDGGRGFRHEWARTSTGVGIAGLVGKTQYHRRRRRSAGGVVEEKVVKTLKLRKAAVDPTPTEPTTTKLETTSPTSGASATTIEQEEEGGEEEEEAEEDVVVQFTTFENQRWWVGLDWTHALLPGERASWTDPSSNPSNPPASFSLPPPQVTYFAAPTATDPRARVKKTTAWRWLDPEWRVLRESVPSVALPAVSPPALLANATTPTTTTTTTSLSDSPPSPTTTTTTTSSSSSIFSSLPSPPANLLSSSSSSSSAAAAAALGAPTPPTAFASPAQLIADPTSRMFAQWQVDTEGWQYGDNHFEKMGPRGGLGKYTRRRAWVRRAGLVEQTERVSGPPPSNASASGKGLGVVVNNNKKVGGSSSGVGIVEGGGGGDDHPSNPTSSSHHHHHHHKAAAARRKSEGASSSNGPRHSSSSTTTTSANVDKGGGGVTTTATATVASLIRKRKSLPPTSTKTAPLVSEPTTTTTTTTGSKDID